MHDLGFFLLFPQLNTYMRIASKPREQVYSLLFCMEGVVGSPGGGERDEEQRDGRRRDPLETPGTGWGGGGGHPWGGERGWAEGVFLGWGYSGVG